MDDLLSEKEQIDKMRVWWSDYGYYVIAGIVLGAAVLFAINYYESSLRESQLEASALYDTLADHIVEGRVEAAENAAGRLASEFADSAYAPQSHLALARLYMDQNRDQDAADTLRELIASNADEVFRQMARVRLAKILLYQDQPEEVLELLGSTHSDAFDARYAEAEGDAYAELNRYDEAREAYQRALSEPNQAATIDQSFVQLKLLDLPIRTMADGTPTDVDNGVDETAVESGDVAEQVATEEDSE